MALGATGSLAVEEVGVGDAADVPDLREDVAACVVDGCGDGLPGFDLLLRPEAGDVGVADAQGVDGSAFGDDEAGGGALGVVVGHDGRGDVVGGAAQAGERGHEDAVGEVEVADLDGIEEGGHQSLLDSMKYFYDRLMIGEVWRMRQGMCLALSVHSG